MSYEDLERQISRMLEEAESDDEVFGDISNEEDTLIESLATQEHCIQSHSDLSGSDDDNVPLSYSQFLNQQGQLY